MNQAYYWIVFFCIQMASVCYAQPSDKPQKEVERLYLLGKEAVLEKGGWLAALSYFGDALRLAREIDYKALEADILHSIAELESQAPYRNDEALEYLFMELKVREKIGDRLQIAQNYRFIGEFFQQRFHMHEEAIGYFRQSIAILKTQQQNPEVQAQLWEKIADAYAFVEDLPNYFATNDSLLNLYKRMGELEKASQLSLKISKEQASLKNMDQSLKYAEKGKRYYSLMDVERSQEKNKELREIDKLIHSLKTQKKTLEEKQKRQYSYTLLLILIPSLIVSWFVWLYLYRKSKKTEY